MQKLIKKIATAVATIATAVAALFTFLFFWKRKKQNTKLEKIKTKAQKTKDEVYEKIQNTDSATLIMSADNADELHAIKDRIRQECTDAIKNRIEKNGL